MPNVYVGDKLFASPVTIEEFVSQDGVTPPTVMAGFRIDGGDIVAVEEIATESYVYEGLTFYSATYDGVATLPMVGGTITIVIYDQSDASAGVEYSDYHVATHSAASAVVSPSSASVAPMRTRQFTVAYYDAFGTLAVPQLSPAWSVNGGGSIDAGSGLFTAGPVASGPHTVTATAGIPDTATVRVVSDANGGERYRLDISVRI